MRIQLLVALLLIVSAVEARKSKSRPNNIKKSCERLCESSCERSPRDDDEKCKLCIKKCHLNGPGVTSKPEDEEENSGIFNSLYNYVMNFFGGGDDEDTNVPDAPANKRVGGKKRTSGGRRQRDEEKNGKIAKPKRKKPGKNTASMPKFTRMFKYREQTPEGEEGERSGPKRVNMPRGDRDKGKRKEQNEQDVRNATGTTNLESITEEDVENVTVIVTNITTTNLENRTASENNTARENMIVTEKIEDENMTVTVTNLTTDGKQEESTKPHICFEKCTKMGICMAGEEIKQSIQEYEEACRSLVQIKCGHSDTMFAKCAIIELGKANGVCATLPPTHKVRAEKCVQCEKSCLDKETRDDCLGSCFAADKCMRLGEKKSMLIKLGNKCRACVKKSCRRNRLFEQKCVLSAISGECVDICPESSQETKTRNENCMNCRNTCLVKESSIPTSSKEQEVTVGTETMHTTLEE